jgi:hypothetical protein
VLLKSTSQKLRRGKGWKREAREQRDGAESTRKRREDRDEMQGKVNPHPLVIHFKILG